MKQHTANGTVEVIDGEHLELIRTIPGCHEGSGVLCTPGKEELVADVEDYRARLVDPLSDTTLASTLLPGRPRWCVFDRARDRFLVNIREPACVVGLAGDTGQTVGGIDVSANGPHGLDLDSVADRAFVACDAGTLVVLDCPRMAIAERVETEEGAHTTAFDSRRQLLYMFLPGSSRASAYREDVDG